MIYGAYKNIRDSAWQCLLDYNIKSLPVDLLQIADASGIKIVKNKDVHELAGNESGKCIYYVETKEWFLIYDDECSLGRRRFTIAHEFGHIFLEHELIHGTLKRTFAHNKPQSETEADMFASRLLAPACVLWGLNIKNADEIAKICEISITAAKIRAERMKELYARNKFLTSPIERKVYAQFEDFIIKNR